MTFQIAGKLLDACVLGVVAEEDTYGYDLTQKVGNLINISESALYPVLRRLSKEGLLTTYDIQCDGRNRKYYQITSEGRFKLKFFEEEWSNFKDIIDIILESEVKDD